MEKLAKETGIGAKALASRPTLHYGQAFYWQAFATLSKRRRYAVGMGGAVPLALEYSEIASYAERHHIEGEAFDSFVAILDAMDDEVLREAGERAAKDS